MASSSDSSTPRGEAWVWFSGLGLIIGLGMVIGLLSLVLLNGAAVFWAPPVPVAQVDDGRVLIGQLAQRRVRAGSPADHPVYERQYQVGLRELNGNSYLWVDEAKIKGETFPADVLGLERVENGPAFVRPQSLRKSDGKVIPATDPAFEAAFQAEVDAAAAVREKLIEITRHRIGDVNAATVRVLTAHGCEVVAPRAQGCCGALELHAGRAASAKSRAQTLIDVLDDPTVAYVVVNSAGCGSTLKEYGAIFANDARWAERAAAFAAKVLGMGAAGIAGVAWAGALAHFLVLVVPELLAAPRLISRLGRS